MGDTTLLLASEDAFHDLNSECCLARWHCTQAGETSSFHIWHLGSLHCQPRVEGPGRPMPGNVLGGSDEEGRQTEWPHRLWDHLGGEGENTTQGQGTRLRLM